ncbi:RES family NAD+ phosphorylase [Porticoccaceae bacterium]|nr:RES family NAD+ phosphorylase [Porticoccaceae bacterium]MDA8682441.1 RES family NAD+ phosphorylase [Porticoccaceae bacterium]MDB2343166.1 RES family NAD+ phosphorylase [Porticoccaceae bacterium]
MNTWSACNGPSHITKIASEVFRVCESQEDVATMNLVGSLADQSLLEDMIERSKPGRLVGHYLVSTPFRYPPLQHGSRFGSKFEPSLFYGSESLLGCFTETAYYRFLFLNAYATQHDLQNGYTSFSIKAVSEFSIDLTKAPFVTFSKDLRSPSHYSVTQALGTEMRNAGVKLIRFHSARSVKSDIINIGLFDSSPVITTPNSVCQWSCHTRKDSVEFLAQDRSGGLSFSLSDFLIGGILPTPS